MKIAIGSDLHMEFGPLTLTNDENADVLVLAGDICIARDLKYLKLDQNIKANRKLAKDAQMFLEFFRTVSQNFPHVIYVVGNHEHYGWDFTATVNTIREALADLTNVHLLEKDTITIEDTTFIGATLWTDMRKGDPFVMVRMPSEMNDYDKITIATRKFGKWKPAKLLPIDVIGDHAEAMHYFREALTGPYEKVVMVTHHAPTFSSVPEMYRNRDVANCAYASDLSEFILDHPQIKLAIHGHMHTQSDYQVGGTRVVCNPRGYLGTEKSADYFVLKYIEI